MQLNIAHPPTAAQIHNESERLDQAIQRGIRLSWRFLAAMVTMTILLPVAFLAISQDSFDAVSGAVVFIINAITVTTGYVVAVENLSFCKGKASLPVTLIIIALYFLSFAGSWTIILLTLQTLSAMASAEIPYGVIALATIFIGIVFPIALSFLIGPHLSRLADWSDQRKALGEPPMGHCIKVKEWLDDPSVRAYVYAASQQGRQLRRGEFDMLNDYAEKKESEKKELDRQLQEKEACEAVYMHPLVGSNNNERGRADEA